MGYPSHPDVLARWDEFRALRRDGLYATDSPAILGLSKWGTPFSVWAEKVDGPSPASPMSLQAFLGLELEGSLAMLYRERYPDRDPVPFGTTFTMTGHPLIKSHLDYIVSPELLLECKTRGRKTDDWGPDGSGVVPADIWVQCQHEMAAHGSLQVDVAALFGLYTFHVYHVPRDQEFLGVLIPKLEAFWADHVIPRIPPALSAHPADTEWSKRWEQTEPGLRNATPEQEELFQRYAMARHNARQAAVALEGVENLVRELIGPSEGIQGAFGTVTYRTSKPSEKVGWKEIAGVYRKMLEELKTPDVQLDAVRSIYSTIQPGSRRLLANFSGDDE